MEEAVAAPGGTQQKPRLESMRIVTGCKTPEQFVAAFYRFCDAKTCFIPSVDTRPVGSSLAFSLRLSDGTPMLRGTCVVKAAWTTKDNAFKRPGVQLAIMRLTAESEAVYEQLLEQKTAVADRPEHVVSAASDGIVEEVTTITTNQHVARDQAIDLILKGGRAPVITMTRKLAEGSDPGIARSSPDDKLDTTDAEPELTPRDETATVEMPPLQYKVESRAAGSAYVLPANPLTDLADCALDEFLACTMAEDDAHDHDPKPAKSADSREAIKTTLGVAPLVPAVVSKPKVQPKTQPMPALHVAGTVVKPVANTTERTRPFALAARAPAARSPFSLLDDRWWFVFALGTAVLAAIVLVSAIAV